MGSDLCNKQDFKDNCGFGLIAQMEGQPSHELLQRAIGALNKMTHRGGIAADGKTGDGCGLLLQKPKAFFDRIVEREFGLLDAQNYAVGMVFLSQNPEEAEAERRSFDEHLKDCNLTRIGWREVPVQPECLGPIALEMMPKIEQIFVSPSQDMDEQQFAANLFMARRLTEVELKRHRSFYICSLSAKIITYKGLMMPADLSKFYSDLSDPLFSTSICVFHQRFSTNTLPRWELAHPFRMLAHNGEINTIMGNRNWSEARINQLQSELLPDLEKIRPLVNRHGSDSSSMDNMLELLVTGGVELYRALRIMIPPAWQNVNTLDSSLKAFYAYNSMLMEPWDGPSGVVITDGVKAVCMLDRNGLRPSRWAITEDKHVIVASEAGVSGFAEADIVAKGRVGPGEMLALDTSTSELLLSHEVDEQLKTRQPYKKWLKEKVTRISSRLLGESAHFEHLDSQVLNLHKKMFDVTFEECDQLLRKMAENGQEAVGSMGDDTPVAVLSEQIRSPYDYFRQQFAQVTNPPIDPLREAIVMSLETCLGGESNLFCETPEHANRIILKSPILSPAKFHSLLELSKAREDYSRELIELSYSIDTTLQKALATVCEQAAQAVKKGKALLHLSDRNLCPEQLPIPAVMATGAIHHHLLEKGLRPKVNLLIETATARNPHHFAVLLGFGGTVVYPYLAYAVVSDLVKSEQARIKEQEALKNFRRSINKGLLKILSKMGISTVASYRGAQLFEGLGLADEMVNTCFKGVPSRIGGASFADFDKDQRQLADQAFKAHQPIRTGGLLKYVHGQEYHAFNPDIVQTLQAAVKQGDAALFEQYTQMVDNRPATCLRDLLQLKPQKSVDISEVEPISAICKRFDSAAMSLGALSPEAHEALAQAMNRIGGRSNSGEGGEDPARFGTDKLSKIKQIASGRFGVTAEYLVNAEVLQIKVAQGAKPGEGGQLPGSKVNPLIARLRYSVPGVTLISPPPHHDIYSIEDLAQLIFDLKQVNPKALISVKLVSEPGVGTIAAGVAKAYADLITISGYDGGTGASPMSSIKHAGSPWELGLAEAHQVLRNNDLRDKVRLQTDGGLKTGLDVIKAAILGAESFGFGTAPMIAMGCKYLRICHLNNCATGIATQDEHLRNRHFLGTVDMIANFFLSIAEQVRRWLAVLGFTSLEKIVGRVDLLESLPGKTSRQQQLDLRPLLQSGDPSKPQTCQVLQNTPYDKGVSAEQIWQDCKQSVLQKKSANFTYPISNADRSMGAKLSGEIAKYHGNQGMAKTPITLRFTGSAGQSFGVWNVGGLSMYLEGEANDYVGKGMTGGKLVIFPPKESRYKSQHSAILGNTCGYGATGGKLLAAGMAGERLGVRNSGAHIVVEGSGDHCCEYMTGGLVCVLGQTGHNFAAGMTGGLAYVLDQHRLFVDRYNHDLVDIHRIDGEYMEAYRSHLYSVIDEFIDETKSSWATYLLNNMDDFIGKFWLVKPKASDLDTLLKNMRGRPE